MLAQKVSYKKRFINEDGQYELKKAATYDRDFGATSMTVDQLRRGIARAKKRLQDVALRNHEMYRDQISAYQKRLDWYYA